MEKGTKSEGFTFTIDELSGYRKDERYVKHLEFVRMWGNAKNRHIVFQDENGVELLWSTNDYTKAYRNFRLRATWGFRVDHIINPEAGMSFPSINISHLTLK